VNSKQPNVSVQVGCLAFLFIWAIFTVLFTASAVFAVLVLKALGLW